MALAWRLALRELRSGVRGFRVFLACLALGVAAIAAAGSTAEAFRQGLASQAREILGGDIAVTVRLRSFTAGERALFERLGPTSYAAGSEAMAQAASGARHIVELRGVSDAYPLAGRVELSGGAGLRESLTPQGDAAGAVVEQALLDRLGVRVGDRILVGDTPMVIRAVLVSEPDRLSRGFALGPRVLTRLPVLERSGLLDEGLPFSETARIAAPPGRPLREVEAALNAGLARLDPAGGATVSDRKDATPGLRRLIDELEYFLGFIGLASLVAGGLGVMGAVSAHLDARRPSIAVLRALGATGNLIRNIYLLQIATLAVLGVLLGVALGAAVPLGLGETLRGSLPVPALFAIYPSPLLRAAGFGLLAAAAFSLAPLARVRATPPSLLFRGGLAVRPRFGTELLGAAAAALGLAVLAVFTAPTPTAAAVMILGAAAAFAVLWALGIGGAALAARGRSFVRGPARIGLANLGGLGSAARTAAPAIGLGVALLTAVVLIQSSLLAQVSAVAPRTAPSLVFSGVPADRGEAFDSAVADVLGRPLLPDRYLRAPFATGRIVAVRGEPIGQVKMARADRWAYDNDITLSALAAEPQKSGVVAGRWWPPGYAGPPLVALSLQAARGARIQVGDPISIEVLGRRIEARVAALRRIDFGGFGANFPVVLDAAALAGADLKAVAIARATPAQERRLTAALGRDFPQVNVISVREALSAAADLFDRLSLAIRGAAAVAALAGLLVLAGAIAARARARAREAAILKVLGVSRGQILVAYAIEYGVVGLVAGLAGVGLGAAAAWPVVTLVFEAHWSVDWRGVFTLAAGASALAAIGGLLAAFQALGRHPAPVLRSD